MGAELAVLARVEARHGRMVSIPKRAVERGDDLPRRAVAERERSIAVVSRRSQISITAPGVVERVLGPQRQHGQIRAVHGAEGVRVEPRPFGLLLALWGAPGAVQALTRTEAPVCHATLAGAF